MPLSDQRDANIDKETSCSLLEHFLTTSSLTNSQPLGKETGTVDLGGSLLMNPPGSLHPVNIPETHVHDDSARYLGPNSIEDIFRPEWEFSKDFLHPALNLGTFSLPRDFDSLDQYVSALDMQQGQSDSPSTDYLTGGERLLPKTGFEILNRPEPFIPLPPYRMQMHSPTNESLGFSGGFVGDGLQEMTGDQETVG
jgi:hypothetical protein